MLTEPEKNLRFNLEHFVKAGSNQVTLARRDVVLVLEMMQRLDAPAGPVAVAAGDFRTVRCAGCGQRFTTEAPAKFIDKATGDRWHGDCAPRGQG